MTSYWAGAYSQCQKGGAIDTFVRRTFPDIEILTSDGLGAPGNANTPEHRYPNAKYVGALCSRIHRDNLILLPLDDEMFERGALKDVNLPAWEKRIPQLFWRGGASGYETPTVRERVVRQLHNNPRADVKFTHWGGWENDKIIPEEHFAPRCDMTDHLNYKYIPIIDGNCIASNHQWVFASGAVPLMITHPDNEYWFKQYIQPMVDHVPIEYDLSDLEETLEWLVTHDAAAQQIAAAAKRMSDTVFSPEFQRSHILNVASHLHSL